MINLLLLFVAFQLTLHHVSSADVTVYYPANTNTVVAQSYLSAIEQMYLDDTTRFKISREKELRVRLCRDALEFSSLTGMNSFFSPLWKVEGSENGNGTLYIMSQGDLDDEGYKAALEAEVIRALLDRLRQNGAPWWLLNSAAIYESGNYKNCVSPPAANVTYFSDLEERIQSPRSRTELNDLCFYLGATGKFFDSKFGAGTLLQLVQEFRYETNFDDAVEKLLQVKREELESDWHDFLVAETEGK
jgi:hypothetical protein